jgi:beta-lactamase class A
MRWVKNSDKAGGSGALQELGDGTSQLSIRDLCVLMIILSDNTAANMLIDLVGMENVNRTLASLGVKQTKLQRKMIRPEASARGEENLSTPAEAARTLEILYRGEFVSREVCDDILSILKKPKEGDINSGILSDVAVAFKEGDLPGVTTAWAIVYLKQRPYIVAVMENYGVGAEGKAAVKDISKLLYDYFWRLGNASKYGTYVDPGLIK